MNNKKIIFMGTPNIAAQHLEVLIKEDLNIIGQLKLASQHLFNLNLFCALLYYLLRKPVSTFFSSRSQKIKNEIEEASIIIDDAQKAYDANSDKLKLNSIYLQFNII